MLRMTYWQVKKHGTNSGVWEELSNTNNNNTNLDTRRHSSASDWWRLCAWSDSQLQFSSLQKGALDSFSKDELEIPEIMKKEGGQTRGTRVVTQTVRQSKQESFVNL